MLVFFLIGRRRDRKHLIISWIERRRHPLYGSAFPGCIPAFHDDERARSMQDMQRLQLCEPILKIFKILVIGPGIFLA